MPLKIILTSDGSHSLEIPEQRVTYHSVHGAIAESMHVFIEAGLRRLLKDQPNQLSILEMGFGTGLNALLTLKEIEGTDCTVYYEALELNPIPFEIATQLNYCEHLKRPDLREAFEEMHKCEWNKGISLHEQMLMAKQQRSLRDEEKRTQLFDLIYFDAFAPNAQPELWTKDVFQKMHSLLKPGGILVTYCSKGDVRRAMQSAGFKVEKLPGPKGKREMVRAIKHSS